MEIDFLKMDGLGNDFVIIDAREKEIDLSAEQVIVLADRKNPKTKGCDQLGVIEKSKATDCFLRIFNADGTEVDICGNILRCVAQILMKEKQKGIVSITTHAGLKHAVLVGANKVKVDMGEPKFDWQDIPLSHMVDTLHLPIKAGDLSDPAAVNMGNPHAVFFVDSVKSIDLESLGPELENNPIFPKKANISVAHVIGDDLIRLRVFERGVGETKACGSGACAAVVAANLRGLSDRIVTVNLPGGALEIEWMKNNRVMMTGPVNHQFAGKVTL